MDFDVDKISREQIPFESEESTPIASIMMTSELDEDAIADGETEPFDWMDLRLVETAFERLIDADESVLEATCARLVLDYPLETPAVRNIRPNNSKAFTRGELMQRIYETYLHIYKREETTQSTPTPPLSEREVIMNRPSSDGFFGIYGHDLNDLGVSSIEVYEVYDMIWLNPVMES